MRWYTQAISHQIGQFESLTSKERKGCSDEEGPEIKDFNEGPDCGAEIGYGNFQRVRRASYPIKKGVARWTALEK